ncbi:MAG: YdbH domain-containing protein [Candidatus Omnitrophota bacterium]
MALRRDVKRVIIVLTVICILFFSGVVFVRPAIKFFVTKKLENIFVRGKVSIGKCVFHPAGEIRLEDIRIVRKDIYSIKLKELIVQYNPLSILKTSPSKLLLNNPDVNITIPKKGSLKPEEYLNIGGGPNIFEYVCVSALNLKANIFGMPAVKLEKGFLLQNFNSGQVNFILAKVNYDKLNITDIKGKAKLQSTGFAVCDFSGNLLGGSIQADLKVQAQGQVSYLLNLKCAQLDIEKFVRDFNLREKFEMTGRISGELRLKAKGARIEDLTGNFSTLSPGGRLVITDTKFLEGMAGRTGQPVDLLVESFKNYQYNNGLVSLGLEDGSVILNADLEGEAGRRNISVVLHDFKIGGQGQ